MNKSLTKHDLREVFLILNKNHAEALVVIVEEALTVKFVSVSFTLKKMYFLICRKGCTN